MTTTTTNTTTTTTRGAFPIRNGRKARGATLARDVAALPTRGAILAAFGVDAGRVRALAERFTLPALLTRDNPKTAKGIGANVMTGVMHLAPVTLAGGANVCPHASEGCAAACLNTAGRGGIIRQGETTNDIQEARKRRTRALFADRPAFFAAVALEIRALAIHAARNGWRAAVRLNGTSDLRFDAMAPALFAMFPRVAFYDYTKDVRKAHDHARGILPANYHVTFSRSETNGADAVAVLRAGGSVAVVFSTRKGAALPATWNGFRVVDADTTDACFLDAPNVVAGLRAKGSAGRDASGFVVNVD